MWTLTCTSSTTTGPIRGYRTGAASSWSRCGTRPGRPAASRACRTCHRSRPAVTTRTPPAHSASPPDASTGLEVQRLPDADPTELLRRLLYTRVADTRFVLDRLAVARRFGADPSRVGMFGHSAGGFTTAETMLVDRRLHAGIDLDGSMAFSFGADDFGEVVHRGLDRPFLLMGAGEASGAPHTDARNRCSTARRRGTPTSPS